MLQNGGAFLVDLAEFIHGERIAPVDGSEGEPVHLFRQPL